MKYASQFQWFRIKILLQNLFCTMFKEKQTLQNHLFFTIFKIKCLYQFIKSREYLGIFYLFGNSLKGAKITPRLSKSINKLICIFIITRITSWNKLFGSNAMEPKSFQRSYKSAKINLSNIWMKFLLFSMLLKNKTQKVTNNNNW